MPNSIYGGYAPGITTYDPPPYDAATPPGMPPMPGMMPPNGHQQHKKKSGVWGTVIGVAAALTGIGLAWRYSANLGINNALQAVKTKGFFPAIRDGVKGFRPKKISDGLLSTFNKFSDDMNHLFKRTSSTQKQATSESTTASASRTASGTATPSKPASGQETPFESARQSLSGSASASGNSTPGRNTPPPENVTRP